VVIHAKWYVLNPQHRAFSVPMSPLLYSWRTNLPQNIPMWALLLMLRCDLTCSSYWKEAVWGALVLVPLPMDSLPLIISDSGVLLLYPETQFNSFYSKLKQDCKRCTPWCSTQTLTWHYFLREGHMVWMWFHLHPQEKYGLSYTDSYGTLKCSRPWYHLHWICLMCFVVFTAMPSRFITIPLTSTHMK